MSSPDRAVVVVTGASSGIGRATALLFARSRCRVVATVRTDEAEASLRAEAAGLDLEVVRLDMADGDAVSRTARGILAAEGRVDVLVNNAGYAQIGAVEDLTDDELRLEFEVNVFGPVRMAREILPSMRARGSGRIVNVSSLAGRISVPLMGAYCASKFALEALSDSMRVEARPFGVRVAIVEPGPVVTRFQRRALEEGRRILASPSAYAAVYGTYLGGAFESNVGATPEQVARTILKAARARRPRSRYRPRLVDALSAGFATIAPRRAIDWILSHWMGLGGLRPAAPPSPPDPRLTGP